MKKIFICSIAALLVSACSIKQRDNQDKHYFYLFTYFTYDVPEAGIRLALSQDGYHWKHLKRFDGVFAPAKNGIGEISDCPSVVQTSDGYYHMVWSTGQSYFGYAKSKNFQNWEGLKKVEVRGGELGKPITLWAPEIFYDPPSQKYAVVFTASTKKIPGLQNKLKWNHKAFVILTEDFQSFSKPKKLLNPDPNLYYIDPYIVYDHENYYTYLKVEAHNMIDGEKDGLHYTTSRHLLGPHRRLSATLDRATGDAEGPTVLRLKDHWLMLYDSGHGRRGALASKNLKFWEDVTEQVEFPEGYRHGSAISIDENLYHALEDQFQ